MRSMMVNALRALRALFWSTSGTETSSPWQLDDQPLRGEPFSVPHLLELAEGIARPLETRENAGDDGAFRARFEDNCRFIASTYKQVVASSTPADPIAPDAEWLVDNYYVVQEQLREIRDDLPRGYYRELPKHGTGPWAGIARVFELAYELIKHTDSSVDEEVVTAFVDAYQKRAPLTIGELWATPSMLRLALVENLRRLCAQMQTSSERRCQARQLVTAWKAGAVNDAAIRSACSEPGLAMHVVELIRDAEELAGGDSVHGITRLSGGAQETVEPYVVAADVYAQHPHAGRGGWTWYTGSAAWMYRIAVESILGLKFHGDRLEMDPCIPSTWSGFHVTLRRGDASWSIAVKNPRQVEWGVAQVIVDGQPTKDKTIVLKDDHGTRRPRSQAATFPKIFGTVLGRSPNHPKPGLIKRGDATSFGG